MISLRLKTLRKKSVPQLFVKRKKAATGLREDYGPLQHCETLEMV